MHFIDWTLMALPFVIIVSIALYTRRYVRSVADFMAGGRHAGPYLLSTAGSEKLAGAALFVATLERFATAGFTYEWWNQLLSQVGPIFLIVAISGFVIYRYRQTRALTLAQFFEMRYSRRFRLFAGMLAFFAGILNFGVIPAIGARFFVYFLGLPTSLELFAFTVPTFVVLMVCFIGAAVISTTVGGQVTILVTDCVQGMLTQIFYVVIAVVMVGVVTWPQIEHVLLTQPAGQSLVNPFDTFKAKDFNLWFVLMLAFANIYGTMAFQNGHSFNSSAATPHDARMGTILGRWRYFAMNVVTTVLGLCALTFLQHPDFAAGAAQVQQVAGQLPDARAAAQMQWPLALGQIMPIGIKGLLCTVLLMGIIAGDGIAMHSWGSILIQDVIMPLKKRSLSVTQHLWLLRLSIIGVAVFALFFGALFQQTDQLFLWWGVTTSIFVGGAGIAIIGGLYWGRGTTAGAWAGMLTGSILCVGGILLQEGHAYLLMDLLPAWGFEAQAADLLNRFPKFPLNGMQIAFFSQLIAIAVYIVVSLLTCRQPHDMDRLLNRGAYAVEAQDPGNAAKKVPLLYRLVGIDEHFSRSDRFVALGIFVWAIFWVLVFVIGSIVYLIHPWSDKTWAFYWRVSCIWLPLVIAAVTTIWFTIGGVRDLQVFFRRLRAEKVDVHDDGAVAHAAAADHGTSGQKQQAGCR
ncbi:MAG TPA: sodium:proline symporter [Opitutaceae bacterium]